MNQRFDLSDLTNELKVINGVKAIALVGSRSTARQNKDSDIDLALYYQENMGYQENWLPYYQKKLGNEVLILTSDKYFPFPNYDINIKPLLGDRYRGESIYKDKGIKVIRKKSLFEITSKSIIWFNAKNVILDFKPDIIHLHGITNINLFQFIYFIKNLSFHLFSFWY